MDFSSVDEIVKAGFEGFVSVAELQEEKCRQIPKERGVYLFVRQETAVPTFLNESIGGHFKDKNPTVPVATLEENWVDNAIVVYIGKAGSVSGKATLFSRLKQYMEFGLGKKIGHWGGRYIWQLEESADLLVCWKPTPDVEPGDVESDLIAQFRAHYGKRPFANLAK